MLAFRDELKKADTFFLMDSDVPPVHAAMTVMVSSRKSVVEVGINGHRNNQMSLHAFSRPYLSQSQAGRHILAGLLGKSQGVGFALIKD